ncbi:oxidoreductase [Bisporella sp. PMI_857]|nr:oxidoreductase [Bisporella sp. PMI_857]
MPAPIKVGFIGYGGSTKTYHLPYLLPHPELEVYAFFQRAEAPPDPKSQKAGSHCTVDFPTAKHYRTSEEFFADKDIELVVICTHTDTHSIFAEQALKNSKHVVVEKPFTSSSEEADRLIAVSKQGKSLLTVYQNRRWDGDFRTLRHIVKEDALGTITEAEIHYDFENPPWLRYLSQKEYTPGSGMMFGLGSHTIDQALLLFGRPKSVTAFLRVLRGIESEVEDSFTIILQYDTPLLVTIKTTTHTPLEHQLKYLVRGTKGSYIKFGTDTQEEHTISGKPSTDPSFGIEDASTHGLLTTYEQFDSKTQTYNAAEKKYVGKYPTIKGWNRGYYENIVDAIRGRAELDVKPEQSRDGIRLIELARLSNETGRTVPWS